MMSAALLLIKKNQSEKERNSEHEVGRTHPEVNKPQ